MYCSKCGKEVNEGAVFCDGCSCPVNNNVNINHTVVNQLSERYKINGVIWIVIAALQIILGMTINWICLIVGILNLISGIQDIKFSKSMLANSAGIIDKVKPLVGPIVVLIYNLIFGGILGVAGSIYYLVGIRSFALKHEAEFKTLEMQI